MFYIDYWKSLIKDEFYYLINEMLGNCNKILFDLISILYMILYKWLVDIFMKLL